MEPVCEQTLGEEILHFHAKLAFSAKSKIKTVHFQSKRLIPAQHFKQTSFP